MIGVAADLLYARGAELAGRMAETMHAKPHIALFNGMHHPQLAALAETPGELVVQQSRRDSFLDLQRAGHMVRREIRQGPFDLVLVLAGRQREQTMGWVAAGARLLADSGMLVLCAANDMGAKGYEKRLAGLGAPLQVSSKAKCRVSLIRAAEIAQPDMLDEWAADAAPRQLPDGMISCPGVFSWAHPDPGSSLLLEHLPSGLAGCGMDLGCGNGYLSRHVLAHHPGIRAWHAVDVDAVAVDCAAQNLQGVNAACSVQTHWMDATRERLPGPMDVVLLNPPFHRDRADLVSLGQAMITAAQRSLQPAGSLFLVANRHLPYELELYQGFAQVRALFEGQGYKVLHCTGVQT